MATEAPSSRPPAGALSVRYALFYAALFLTIGIYVPFWPLWLAGRGLSPGEIGIIFALGSWSRIVANPAMARIADRSRNGKAVVVVLSATALLIFTGFISAQGFWLLLAINLAAALAHQPIMPLAESQTMAAVVRGRLDYGRIRLWGSLAFIVGTVGAGRLMSGRDAEIVLYLILAGLALTFACALALPRQEAPAGVRASGGMRALITKPQFMIFLLAAGLLQASHAAYYGFSALHWRTAGLSETAIGWLWAEGVIAEVALFAVSGAAFARLGARGLLGVAAVAGMVRWTVMGATTGLTSLIAIQVLHAATFGAAHLGAMHFIARQAPPGQAATAQALYSVISGVAVGLAMWTAGRIFEAHGPIAFQAMAVLSAFAGALLMAPMLNKKKPG